MSPLFYRNYGVIMDLLLSNHTIIAKPIQSGYSSGVHPIPSITQKVHNKKKCAKDTPPRTQHKNLYVLCVKKSDVVGSRRSFSSTSCPVGMEKFATWLIQTLVGMSAEVIALCL
jgi:hypothetical protein